jgi:gluconolactonase
MKTFRKACSISFLLLLLFAILTGCAQEPAEDPTIQPEPEEFGSIERADPRFDALVPPNARIEILAEGFDWAEGPVWVPDGGFLLFSDVPQNVVFKWKEDEGLSEYLRPSGFTGSGQSGREPGSNGLLLDAEAQLVLCQHGDRRISRLAEDGSFVELVGNFEGKRFNSPNDATFMSNGDLYFTDPPYGLTGLNDSPLKELEFNGVYLLRQEGTLLLLTDQISFPNGIALTPDEKHLYVAVSDRSNPVLMIFDLREDGLIENGRVFFDTKPWMEAYKGVPDGLKVDEKGNVFATGPGGVNVFSPEGDFLGRINTGVATANCGWGDDGSVLYITADSYLLRVKTSTKGHDPFDR